MKKVHLAVGISLSLLFASASRADELISLDDPAPAPAPAAAPAPKAARGKPAGKPAAAPAPAAGGLESLDSLDDSTATAPAAGGEDAPADLGGGGDAEVALDTTAAFNPYTFARTEAWSFLPIGALILVGLHLLRVPKRKSKRKLDQARRFFRGISGEGTNSSILMPPKPKDGNN